MENKLSELAPQNVWKHFFAMCNIPHVSKHEEAISKYVIEFAEKNGIECHVDEVGNVLLRKPATEGMEGRKAIVLQGHLDMVAQKNGDKDFDFLTDPISPYIDGEWLTADGTTLGADNGIGVAASLAIMEDDSLTHGPIEALFTIDEETGMTGAFGLQPGFLQGEILLNLDSEDEGELYVGCAGGVDAMCYLPIKREAVGEGFTTFTIELKGLKGGHSGLEIILQRGNANKALSRIIGECSKVCNLRVVSLQGGDVRNAIPRESAGVVAVENSSIAAFESKANEIVAAIIEELKEREDSITMSITKSDVTMSPLDQSSSKTLINLINVHPNGVIRMSDSLEGLVETSINLGVIKTQEDKIECIALIRSSSDRAKDYLASQIESLYELAGGKASMDGSYSGWIPNMESSILQTMKEGYKAMYGKTPEVKAIHAGLECGIIGGVYHDMDMISLGPTIRYPHSPDEKVNIQSVEKFYNFLTTTVSNAPLK
ncbi:MAG: aminoacyl-histidine dipeptidase [Rikenellaceae bacterium]